MNLAKRKSLVGLIKSDSGGMRKVRRHPEWAERIGDEQEAEAVKLSSFSRNFAAKGSRKTGYEINFSLKQIREHVYMLMGMTQERDDERWKTAGLIK